jgi:thioester reductase-like protein
MSTTLITGATGFLGREVTRALLAADPQLRLVAVVRARDQAALDGRLDAIRRTLSPVDEVRLVAVAGDVSEPRLGLEPAAWERLAGEVERIVHVAATTRFDLSLADARRQNVDGTRGVLDLCRTIRTRGRSGRLDYVSTAYVAGDRTGLAREDELEAGQSFRNTYERSKCEAERLCRDAAGELPVAIHRPSIIVGRAATGETTSYTTIYKPMAALVRFYALWRPLVRLVRLPVGPDCPLDLVPVDWVGGAVAALYARPQAAGRCFHLTAGPEGALTIAEAVRIACGHFGVPAIGFVDPSGPFRLVARTLRPVVGRIAPRAVRLAEIYQPYTVTNPSFDTTNARAMGLEPPPAAEYFQRLVAFAHGTDFGRRRPQASDGAGRGASAAA